jgi:hypothetical protein
MANALFVNEPVVTLDAAASTMDATNEALSFAAYTFTLCRFKNQRNQDAIYQSAMDLFAKLGYDQQKIGFAFTQG